MSLLIKNGRIVDPANNLNEINDILVRDSKIAKVAKNIKENNVDQIIDAKNKIVMPGIVDMHVHLRDPGREDKETIASGTMAALKGGVTSVLAMPNTMPAIDCVENVQLLKGIIKNTANCNVFIAGAITKNRIGKELTNIVKLKKQGVVAITDDGASVDDAQLLFKAFKKAKDDNCLVICHCEDGSLSAQGVVNLGIISTRLGLKGISNESEYKRIQRDIQIAKKAGSPLHIAHLSCKESVEAIAKAKKNGLKITADTAPHYFCLSEVGVLGYDTNKKMNPPLRSKDDVKAIKQGLKDGTIDAIASDHAPHTENEKDIEFERAEFGVIGLETELAVSITELIEPGLLSWLDLVKKLSFNPAKILGLDKPSPCVQGLGKGTLRVGADADIIIVDPQQEWVVKREDFISKSKNSCFIGRKLKGVVEFTILAGKIVYKAKD